MTSTGAQAPAAGRRASARSLRPATSSATCPGGRPGGPGARRACAGTRRRPWPTACAARPPADETGSTRACRTPRCDRSRAAGAARSRGGVPPRQERPQIGAEGDDAALLGRAHPQLDLGRLAALHCVETVQLAPLGVRTRRQHLDLDGRDVERVGEAADQPLGRPLHLPAVLGGQRGRERGHARVERGRVRQTNLGDLIALPIDRLLRARQPRVVRERHSIPTGSPYRPCQRGLRFSTKAWRPRRGPRSCAAAWRGRSRAGGRRPATSPRPLDHRLLGVAQGHRRLVGHGAGQRLRRRQRLGHRDHALDQPDAQRLRGGDAHAGQDHLERLAATDHARQPLGAAAARDDGEVDLGEARAARPRRRCGCRRPAPARARPRRRSRGWPR